MQELRKNIVLKREQLSDTLRQKSALIVTRKLKDLAIYQKSKHIAIYIAVRGEMTTRPIIEQIWQDKKFCYLPVITSKKLSFALYQEKNQLINNRFGIPEPDHKKYYPTEKLDIIIMPLVAFDNHYNRLGKGGGYYDRTLENISPKPYLIGLAYEMQRYNNLVVNPWDIPPDLVLTEKQPT